MKSVLRTTPPHVDMRCYHTNPWPSSSASLSFDRITDFIAPPTFNSFAHLSNRLGTQGASGESRARRLHDPVKSKTEINFGESRFACSESTASRYTVNFFG